MRMTNVVGIALALAISPALAEPTKHVWFNVDYANGGCVISAKTPKQMFNTYAIHGAETGVTIDRIDPGQVFKDDKGNIHVHMTGKHGDHFIYMDYFTSAVDCKKFVVDQGVKPQQADGADIN